MSDLHTLVRPRDVVMRGGTSATTLTVPSMGVSLAYDERVAIPAGRIEPDLRSLQIAVGDRENGALTYRTRIGLGERAEANILIRFEDTTRSTYPKQHAWAQETPGVQSRALLSTALEIQLAAGSRLRLFIISALSGDYFREAFDSAKLGSGASLEWTTVNFDTNDGIYSSTIELEGEGSSLDFGGAYVARRRTEQEHVLSVHHLSPHTKSLSSLKSALKGSSHLIFRGLIRVDPSAPGTDAYLSNRNLVLEDGARAESLPQLKIETDDVACSHGATTGGPRQEELFYLMSRGLDRQTAKSVLVQGHLGSVFARAPTALAEELEELALCTLEPEAERSRL